MSRTVAFTARDRYYDNIEQPCSEWPSCFAEKECYKPLREAGTDKLIGISRGYADCQSNVLKFGSPLVCPLQSI